jgi:NDP-sugar pyrophosphorylase family protein
MNKLKVIILAAGFGERFAQSLEQISLSNKERKKFFFSHSLIKPKALLKVGGQEILLRNLGELQKIREIALAEDVALITNHKYYQSFKNWLKQKGFNIKLIDNGVARAEDKLGAVADLYKAIQEADISNQPLLVLSSDTLFSRFKIKQLIKTFWTRSDQLTVFPVYREERRYIYKRAWLNFDPRTKIIKKFVEKPKKLTNGKTFWASPAVYLYNKQARRIFLPKYLKAAAGDLSRLDSPGLFNEYLIKQKGKRAKVAVLKIKGRRFDIGDYAGWRAANEYFSKREAKNINKTMSLQ